MRPGSLWLWSLPIVLAARSVPAAERPEAWKFHVIRYRTEAVRHEGLLGVKNSLEGRGFYVSNPFPVRPGAAYSFAVSVRTQNAPESCAFARVFWYQGPDRGRASSVRRYDDTVVVGGTTDWTVLKPKGQLIAPKDATVAAIRFESNSPKVKPASSEQAALAGRAIYQQNWRAMLQRRGITFRDCGAWLAPTEFANYKLVILCNATPGRKLIGEENGAIRKYLERGGHLILTISTPYSMAGGRDIGALDWLGAAQCRYGHLGKAFVVLNSTGVLTDHLEPGARVYETKGKVGGLRMPKGKKGLVGNQAYAFIHSRVLGKGRVTYLGNNPSADPKSQPRFRGIIAKTSAEAQLETEAPRRDREFAVWFKDVSFKEASQ